MARRVCILQGHPHAGGGHYCHALADAYAEGAAGAGAGVDRIEVGEIRPDPLWDPAAFATPPDGPMEAARTAISDSEHLVVVFPLWLGTMPAALKAFFEQMARAEFALGKGAGAAGWPERKLKGRSARVIVTMGMPALAYRLLFFAHGVANLRRGILGMSGFSPVRTTMIGRVEDVSQDARADWLRKVRELGARRE